MAGNEKVNSQIVDSVIVSTERVIGDAIAESHGVTLEAFAHSLALVMHNAGSTQYAAQQVEGASVAMTCAAILKA